MNVSEILRTAALSYRDTEVLLQHVLKKSRSWLHTHPEYALTPDELATWEQLASRRAQSEPVAYLIGEREFYGRLYRVTPDVLIPRPETEQLVEVGTAFLRRHTLPAKVLELGTGSGCITVSLALETAKDHCYVATDLSESALQIARGNAARYEKEEAITWLESDLFAHPQLAEAAPFHLILANLPYLPEGEPLSREVAAYEPASALYSGSDGLDLYRAFFRAAPAFLAANGMIAVEFGDGQHEAMQELARDAFPDKTVSIYRDYADLPRILTAN